MQESEIDRWLGRQLRGMGCLYYKWVSPGCVGVPDRIVIIPGGRILFLELKTENGDLSAAQKFQIRKLKAAGVPAGVIHGMPEAAALVKTIRESITKIGAIPECNMFRTNTRSTAKKEL